MSNPRITPMDANEFLTIRESGFASYSLNLHVLLTCNEQGGRIYTVENIISPGGYMDPKELGRQVLARRREKHWSQEELGQQVGISRNYVSMIERGEANRISMKVINQLSIALGASISQLTGEVANQSMVMIPPALREFGLENNLSYEAIDKLANIPRRGKEPKSVKEWQELYTAISQFIEGE